MNWRIPPVGTWGGTSLLLAALSLPLFATAQSVAAPWQGLRTVGQGEMRWLWFKLYDATLYSESGRYEPGRYPQALTLTYARASSSPPARPGAVVARGRQRPVPHWQKAASTPQARC